MSTNIEIANPLIPGAADTPLDARSRAATLADVENITLPYVGMTFYVIATQKWYRVMTLKSKTIGAATVPNAAIDTYEEVPAGDMKKSVYDADNDGVVDQATTALNIGGKTAAEVAAAVDAAANIPSAGVDGGFAPLSGGKIPSQYLNANASTHVVADIAARDALTPTLAGERAFVTDATGDTTVSGGAAEYVWTGSAWSKIAEAESLDLILDWGNLQNKPGTFPPESHEHEIADVSGLQTALDGKAGIATATAEANGLMSAADKTRLDGIDIVSDFNVTELDSDSKAAVASAGIVGVVDDSGVQWAITDEMISYADGEATVDFSGILARKGISAISGTWRLIVSGGSGSSAVSMEQVKQESAKAAIIFG